MGLIIICVSLVLLILHLIARNIDAQCELKVRDLRISKKKFVLFALKWCTENLGTNNRGYVVEIRYYPIKKFSASTFPDNKIVIYVYDELRLIDLVDTVIHEYTHHLQHANRNTEADYNKQLNEVGYWQISYEIEARSYGKKFRNRCMSWLIKDMGKQ